MPFQLLMPSPRRLKATERITALAHASESDAKGANIPRKIAATSLAASHPKDNTLVYLRW